MNSGISRRKLVTTAGAAAAGAAMSTVGCAEKTIRVNLICHGMMMFHFDKNDQDHFTILIPPQTDHVYSLTSTIGETGYPGNLLVNPDGGKRTGHYELTLESGSQRTFQREHSNFHRTRGEYPDGKSDVVLHDPDTTKTLIIQEDKVAFFIKVPYPTDIVALRNIMLPDKNPYMDGKTVRHFMSPQQPAQIGGVHVYSYDKALNSVKIRCPDGSSVPISANGDWLNIHLYAQPMKLPTKPMGSIGAFDQMAKYMDTAGLTSLDLTPNTKCSRDHQYPVPDPPLDRQLSVRDLEDLDEIHDPAAVRALQPQGTKEGAGGSTPWDIRTLTPVDCLQGYGT